MTPVRAARRPLLLAHRGDHRIVPENTLAAFNAAAALPGCDGVELDVRLAADGEAVVLHDATLDRVQLRAGSARDLAADELATFGVPRLADVLDSLPRSFFVDVELKEPAVDAVAAVLDASRSPEEGRIALSSFDAAILEAFAEVAPGWPRWLIARVAEPAFAIAQRIGCRGLALEVSAIDSRVIERCHTHGLAVVAWTIRDQATRRAMTTHGVDAICAEGPGLSAPARPDRWPSGQPPPGTGPG